MSAVLLPSGPMSVPLRRSRILISISSSPSSFVVAFAWDATEELVLSAGATYTTWSLYDDLVIDLHGQMLPGVSKLESEKKWHDTWRLSFGADWKVDFTKA